jgi:hypothetical protein
MIRHCIKFTFKSDKQIWEKALDPSGKIEGFDKSGI